MRMPLAYCSFVAMSSLWSVGAVAAPRPEITVRVYGAAGVKGQWSEKALDTARQTLAAAFIDVVWQHCSRGRCERPLALGELVLRLVQAPGSAPTSLPAVLGNALIDQHEASGVLASVYVDAVRRLALETESDNQLLLGRVIAHELGHLLLGSTRHEPVGLMRAAWLHDEIRRNRRRDWAFTLTDATTMVKRVAVRSGDHDHRASAAIGPVTLAAGQLVSELGEGTPSDRVD